MCSQCLERLHKVGVQSVVSVVELMLGVVQHHDVVDVSQKLVPTLQNCLDTSLHLC